MTFKKLALVAAIAAVPMGVQAVETLDDAMLADVTGQDGVRVRLALDVTTDVIIHDLDGINAAYQAGYGFDGAIVMSGVGLNTQGNNLVVDIDAGDSSTAPGTAPTLNINVTIPNGTTIQTGNLTVANSNRDDGAWGFEAATESAVIMQNATITLGTTQLNIQLGNEPQGNMISIVTAIAGGVSISNFALNDVGGSISGGAIGAGLTTIVDNGGVNLNVDVGVDVDTASGLVVTINQLGLGTGIDVRMERQYLGTTTLGYVGDVELVGVTLDNNTIAISGK